MPLEKWDPDTDFLIGSWTIGRTPKHPNAVIGKQTSDALTVAYWSGVAHESEPEATAAGWSVVLALAHRSVCIIGWQTAACRTKRPSLSHHANSRHSGRLIVAAAGRYAVDRPPATPPWRPPWRLDPWRGGLPGWRNSPRWSPRGPRPTWKPWPTALAWAR